MKVTVQRNRKIVMFSDLKVGQIFEGCECLAIKTEAVDDANALILHQYTGDDNNTPAGHPSFWPDHSEVFPVKEITIKL